MPLLESIEKQGNYLFRKRGILPLIIVAIGLPVTYYARGNFFHLMYTKCFELFELFCLVICFLGQFIRVITVGYTPEGTSGRNTDKQVADELNQRGMYSIVRHPLYLGNFFMWLGVTLLTLNFWYVIIVILFYWIYYERIMFSEEQFLRRKYGVSYLEWASTTPTFVPKFSKWQSPEGKFNVRKVLRQEKNGLVAIFLIFFTICITREGENLHYFFVHEWYWVTSLGISLLLYLVLKYLKYNTKILSEI